MMAPKGENKYTAWLLTILFMQYAAAFDIKDDFFLEASTFLSLGSGSPVIPAPRCTMQTNGDIQVTDLDPRIGCVMRDDSYDELAPTNGSATFTGPAPTKATIGVEIYRTLRGHKDCIGYIGDYGTIFCSLPVNTQVKSEGDFNP
eukprot:Sdes_comp15399_c0_seq1m4278